MKQWQQINNVLLSSKPWAFTSTCLAPGTLIREGLYTNRIYSKCRNWSAFTLTVTSNACQVNKPLEMCASRPTLPFASKIPSLPSCTTGGVCRGSQVACSSQHCPGPRTIRTVQTFSPGTGYTLSGLTCMHLVRKSEALFPLTDRQNR